MEIEAIINRNSFPLIPFYRKWDAAYTAKRHGAIAQNTNKRHNNDEIGKCHTIRHAVYGYEWARIRSGASESR